MSIGLPNDLLDFAMFVTGFPEIASVKGYLSDRLGKQRIGLGGWGIDRQQEGRFDVDDTCMMTVTAKDSTPDTSSYVGGGWLKAIASLLAAVKGKAPLLVLPEQTLIATRILELAAKSAATGKEVAFS